MASRHIRSHSALSTALDIPTRDTPGSLFDSDEDGFNAKYESTASVASSYIHKPSFLNHVHLPPLRRSDLTPRCLTLTLLFFSAFLVFLLGAHRYSGSSAPLPDIDAIQRTSLDYQPWYPTPRGGVLNDWRRSYLSAVDRVSEMSLVEKVNLTTGTGWMMDMCVGNTGEVPSQGIPPLCLQDGPLGVRFADRITAFPAGLTVGATWNKELMYQRGRALGLEARTKGINVLLGPSIGPIGKLPAGGRNWEGFGADPVLQSHAAAITIEGIQGEGVMATAKHFVGNEQEHFRTATRKQEALSANIDDRTLHEIYAWPFADAIRAGVASIMCSYNQVNNSYACENSKLLNGILKDELGFQGFVQSDWLAQKSGVESAIAGLDMSMPGDSLALKDGKPFWGQELTKAVLNGTVPVERINDMALRIVAAWFQLGQNNRDRWPARPEGGPNFSSWTWDEVGLVHPASDDKTTARVNRFTNARFEHHTLARKIAAEGIVLVKNEENLLPLSRDGYDMTRDKTRKLKVALYGEDGYGNPKGANACEDRACNDYTLAQAWGSGSVEFPYLVSPADAMHVAFVDNSAVIDDYPTNTPKLDKASTYDVCIVYINSDSGEGYLEVQGMQGDRNSLYAQKGGDELVKNVAQRCSNVIVVVHAVGPVILEEWVDLPNVKAVLLAHLPGQESGNALADVLFGTMNPSGRLPYTVARSEEDYGPTSKVMLTSNARTPQQDFTERLYFDYRYFDAFNIAPRYEFGFGLSYTEFRISNVIATPLIIVRTALPEARSIPPFDPPEISRAIPSVKHALLPKSFHRLARYIYPYINSAQEAKPKGRYNYPQGYEQTRVPSEAGGGLGGNPDLYKVIVFISGEVENLGRREGSCVVQLYISFPPNMRNSLDEVVDMPPRVLRKFDKKTLGAAGEPDSMGKIAMELTRRDLSYWDRGLQNWVLPTKGAYKVWLGQSSRHFDQGASVIIPFRDS